MTYASLDQKQFNEYGDDRRPPNPTMIGELRTQAGAIYQAWLQGNKATARAMLAQVPSERTAYVTMVMTVLAVHEGLQFPFSQFIEGATQ